MSCYRSAVEERGNITTYIENANGGGAIEASALWSAVSDEIHGMATALCTRESYTITIQPTMLVNEVWIKLYGECPTTVTWKNRNHFFGSVSRALGQVLIDYARSRNCKKRGGTEKPIPLQLVPGELGCIQNVKDDTVLTLSKALIALGLINERAEEVARMKYILGIPTPVIAQLLEISERTVRNDWRYAQAWLRRELSKQLGFNE